MVEEADFKQKLIDTLMSERKASGMSHEAVAIKAKISRQTIGKIEGGLTNPTMLTVYKITTALGIDFELFIKKMFDKQ